MAAVATMKQTRENEIRFVNKSIEARLKHSDCIYDDILSLAKCRMSVGYEKENKRKKKEESEQLKQPYVCSLISFNWLMFISLPPGQLMLPPPHPMQIPSLRQRLSLSRHLSSPHTFSTTALYTPMGHAPPHLLYTDGTLSFCC